MKILIATSGRGFPHNVDHMPGATVKSNETIHDNYKKWKQHADHVNSKFHDDNADVISAPRSVHYEADGTVFAVWDSTKKIGTVQNVGKSLSGNIMKILISMSAGRSQAWFDSLTKKEQKAYLAEHPNSKFAQGVKTKAEISSTRQRVNKTTGDKRALLAARVGSLKADKAASKPDAAVKEKLKALREEKAKAREQLRDAKTVLSKNQARAKIARITDQIERLKGGAVKLGRISEKVLTNYDGFDARKKDLVRRQVQGLRTGYGADQRIKLIALLMNLGMSHTTAQNFSFEKTKLLLAELKKKIKANS